jgi:hypothetical protein
MLPVPLVSSHQVQLSAKLRELRIQAKSGPLIADNYCFGQGKKGESMIPA